MVFYQLVASKYFTFVAPMEQDILQIFEIKNKDLFIKKSLQIFHYQYDKNLLYRDFVDLLGVNPNSIDTLEQIPFLPISFFKSHAIITGHKKEEKTFLSSGTTGTTPSKHLVSDLKIYEKSFRLGFYQFYGAVSDYTILALLPNYLERKGSSLIYMVDHLIKESKSADSGFYLHDLKGLAKKLIKLDKQGKKVLLIGVSFALLDLIDFLQFNLKNTLIMETGGMKGRRKEMIREELHQILCKGFGVGKIHSEYGMTELLSQAYSHGNGIFSTPPWMHVFVRDTEEAQRILPNGKVGGLNIIDLANVYSCPFIATQDLGKTHANGTFEIVGRFDNSDIRGCNLLVV